ncbi:MULTISPECIES: DUF4376 domain-containing protein [Enterobacteriaceae]
MAQLCSDTDNDSEVLAATPKAVKTVMDETKTKAPLDSPAFTVTPELIAVGKDARKWEIEVWRTEQEAQPFTFEWNGHTWNGGPDSLARLYPVVMAAGANSGQWDVMTWSDADNQQVKLSMTELEELAAAMAQVDRNNEIYRHQREMKEELSNLLDLKQVREFSPE